MSKQRFSLRKYKFGVASVLLGSVLVFGAGNVSADEAKQPETAVVASAEANQASPSESASPVTNQASEQTTGSVVEMVKLLTSQSPQTKGQQLHLSNQIAKSLRRKQKQRLKLLKSKRKS